MEKKLKEVDVVNSAIYQWILECRANDLFAASRVQLNFTSSFDLEGVIGILGTYSQILEEERISDHKKRFYTLILRYDRRLKKSARFKQDLQIVASFINSYEVLEFR